MPIPEPLLSESSFGKAVFSTRQTIELPSSWRSTLIEEGSEGEIPCLKAFSTKGMNSMGAICLSEAPSGSEMSSLTSGEHLMLISLM